MKSWAALLAYASAIGVAAWAAWGWVRFRRTVIFLLRAILDALRNQGRPEDRREEDDR